ncbi:MAG: acetylglutamate kinase [Planctomycetes bacterium]|nr:acetylglutamate kinase [Planctomycetota bacterium]
MSAVAGIAPVVIKIGGRALEDQIREPALWRSILDIHRKHGVILMHGGGAAVDRQLARLGLVSEKRDGIRITPPDHMEQIVGVLAGVTNKTLVGAINRESASIGISAIGMCLGDGGLARTRVSKRYGFDAGRVGEVESCDDGIAHTLLAAGYLPVVCSIGLDANGDFLNINADDAATGLASRIRARALVLLTDVPGIKGNTGLVSEIDHAGIEAMIASGEISGGMIVKARSAVETAKAIGSPVVILSGQDASAIQAWASGNTVGTKVVPR